MKKHGHAARGKNSKTYTLWVHMKGRCENPTYADFHAYGERGIKVCSRWQTFENFLMDIGEKQEGRSLGRIDNNGSYSKENCRWETPKQQARNRRSTTFLTIKGETKPAPEWCEIMGIPYRRYRSRLRRGWPIERIFSTPLTRIRSADGKTWKSTNV